MYNCTLHYHSLSQNHFWPLKYIGKIQRQNSGQLELFEWNVHKGRPLWISCPWRLKNCIINRKKVDRDFCLTELWLAVCSFHMANKWKMSPHPPFFISSLWWWYSNPTLDGGEWFAAHPGHYTLQKNSVTHWIRGLACPTSSLDILHNRNHCPLWGLMYMRVQGLEVVHCISFLCTLCAGEGVLRTVWLFVMVQAVTFYLAVYFWSGRVMHLICC
jgi:hypothetical protein